MNPFILKRKGEILADLTTGLATGLAGALSRGSGDTELG